MKKAFYINELRSFLIILIHETATGSQVKSGLLVKEVTKAFKAMVQEAGAAAAFIEAVKNTKDSRENDNRELVDGALDILQAIRAIDKDIYVDLCLNAGFTSRQLGSIDKSFDKSAKHEITATQILFESQALGILLLQNPKISSILAADTYDSEEDDLDAFVRYVVQEGLPHVQLEKIARLSIYQRHNFEKDIEDNAWLTSHSVMLQGEWKAMRPQFPPSRRPW